VGMGGNLTLHLDLHHNQLHQLDSNLIKIMIMMKSKIVVIQGAGMAAISSGVISPARITSLYCTCNGSAGVSSLTK
jgi:hypothetical protein